MNIEKRITKNKLTSEKMNIEKRKTNQIVFAITFKVLNRVQTFFFVLSFRYIALSNSCISYQFGPAIKIALHCHHLSVWHIRATIHSYDDRIVRGRLGWGSQAVRERPGRISQNCKPKRCRPHPTQHPHPRTYFFMSRFMVSRRVIRAKTNCVY